MSRGSKADPGTSQAQAQSLGANSAQREALDKGGLHKSYVQPAPVNNALTVAGLQGVKQVVWSREAMLVDNGPKQTNKDIRLTDCVRGCAPVSPTK